MYIGVDLVKTLHEPGIACLGTVRTNSLPNCKMTTDQALKKSDRGSVELWTTNYDCVELRAVKWFDNRGVTLLSTYESVNPTSDMSCFDFKEKNKVKVTSPSIVTTCNKFMGDLDLSDGLLSLHRIHLRSKKRYHKLMFHFFDMAVVQPWNLYRRHNESNTKLKLRNFKMQIVDYPMQK